MRCSGWVGAAAAAAGLALVGAASPAHAHLTTSGSGSFHAGIAHLALTPEDLVPLAALALLAGMGGAAQARAALTALVPIWLAAGLVGRDLGAPAPSFLPALSFLLLGGLVAVDASLSRATVVLLAALFAGAHGYADGVGLPGGRDGFMALVGIALAVACSFTVVASAALPAQGRVGRTAVRVAGSWIAAAGVLLLGWILRASLSLAPAPS
jgi:hydrogenase/urease accessory protein HupE